MIHKQEGFTLMELMVTVFIVGLIAAFSIPRYQKSLIKNERRLAVMNLKTIHNTNKAYFSKNRVFYPETAGVKNLADINLGLNLSLIEPTDTTVTTCTINAPGYTCSAVLSNAETCVTDDSSPDPVCS